MRQKKTINRPQPQPPHRRGTFHRRLQPLYTEKHKDSCSGFLPKTQPLQHHAAIPMRSASTDSKTPYNYVKSHTTLHQGQVSIAHHPSSFQVSEFYLSVTRKYCFPTSFDKPTCNLMAPHCTNSRKDIQH